MTDIGGRSCKRNRACHRAQWRKHVEAQGESGFSAAAYCREHGLSRRSFYRWRGIFNAEDGTRSVSGLGGPPKACAKPATFAEVRVASLDVAVNAASGVGVVLQGERRLEVEPGFDADTLRRVVAVLESLPC